MVAFQFITQRMTIPKGGGADETQRRMNSILQFMPLIFGITALNFPTGPVLYWVTTSIFSTIQQYFITGFQSLTDVPGLGFLPVKEIKLPQLEKKSALPATNPDGTPRKKTLMERLAEQQDKIQTDKAKTGETASETTTASADAGRPAPTNNNFGRRTGAGPLTSKNSNSDSAFGTPSNPSRQLGRPPKKPPSNEGRSNKGKK
jgi:YidC/Oxa1 family membrane protein insertase